MTFKVGDEFILNENCIKSLIGKTGVITKIEDGEIYGNLQDAPGFEPSTPMCYYESFSTYARKLTKLDKVLR